MKTPKQTVVQILLLTLLVWAGRTHSDARAEEVAIKKVFNNVSNLKLYDLRLRPNYGVNPVKVKVGFTILSIDTINAVDMDYTIDLFLRQQWSDKRLDHGLNTTIFLSHHLLNKIWKPDSYFVNAKESAFHDVTTDNMAFMLGPGGHVLFNSRVTIKASCPMDLQSYPMDTQYCPLTLESYGYDDRHISFHWESKNGMEFIPTNLKILPQFSLVNVDLRPTHTSYIAGNWTGISMMLTLRRTFSNFMYDVYGPCFIIVVMSWVAFLLPRDNPPARITLGVTAVLTIVTILHMLNSSVAKVNYVKNIDKYLITCLLFVFGTLAEYCVILFLRERIAKYRKSENERREKKRVNATAVMMENSFNSKYGYDLKSQPENPKLASTHSKPSIFLDNLKRVIYSEVFLTRIDEFSLICFPLSFGIFNFYYWISILYFLQPF